jgi:hypothetical protein
MHNITENESCVHWIAKAVSTRVQTWSGLTCMYTHMEWAYLYVCRHGVGLVVCMQTWSGLSCMYVCRHGVGLVVCMQTWSGLSCTKCSNTPQHLWGSRMIWARNMCLLKHLRIRMQQCKLLQVKYKCVPVWEVDDLISCLGARKLQCLQHALLLNNGTRRQD